MPAAPPVVHLTPFPAPGAPRPAAGVPAFMARLLPAYAEAGAGPQLALADRARGAPRRARPHPGVEVVRAYAPGPRFGAVAARLARAPARLVHAQHEVFLYGGPAAALQFPAVVRAARRRGRPAVVTVHGVVDLATVDRAFVRANGARLPPAAARALLARLIGAAARAGDAVVVHEEELARRLTGQYGVRAERVSVIPLPVPEAAPLERAQARATVGLERPTALFFGFVTGYKGLPLLLDAWERYRRGGGAGELAVAGGRHPRLAGAASYERGYAALEARARRIGGVRWEGYVAEEDVPAWLSGADVLVLPYRDGLSASGPMSFALAYGLPVLASDAIGDAAPDPAGVFPRDPEALAGALRAALESPLRDRLAESSRRAAGERSLAAVARRTVALYRRLGA